MWASGAERRTPWLPPRLCERDENVERDAGQVSCGARRQVRQLESWRLKGAWAGLCTQHADRCRAATCPAAPVG